MPKTKVSVLLITVRWGGLGWQIRYLAQQTHHIDEFIVVDGFYDLRHESMRILAKELDLNLVHLREPKLSYHTSHNRCSNVNYAIAHARYPLCIFIDDWHVLPNDFVETHVRLFNDGYASVVRWVHTPFMELSDYNSFHERVQQTPPPSQAEAEYHCAKQKNKPSTQEARDSWVQAHVEDPRITELMRTAGRGHSVKDELIVNVPSEWWWPNSTGAPLEYLLAVNGFDETFNGGGGCEDVDIARRMSWIGLKYAMDPRITCYHVDTASLPVRPTKPPLCAYHDKSPFTYNAYHQGDPDLVENDQLLTWKVNGVKFCKCKICGWQGLIDSGEYLRSKEEFAETRAPVESLGIKRTDFEELRSHLELPVDGSVEE